MRLPVNSEEISHGLRGLRRFQSVKSAQSVAESPFLIRSFSDLDTASINDLGNGGSKSWSARRWFRLVARQFRLLHTPEGCCASPWQSVAWLSSPFSSWQRLTQRSRLPVN